MPETIITEPAFEIEKRYTVDKRIYHVKEMVNGVEEEYFFPSVTTILDFTEPKNPQLEQFKLEEVEKKGIEGARFALFMAAERGTKIHKAIEDFNNGLPVYWFEKKKVKLEDGTEAEVEVKMFDDHEWKCVCRYMDWKSKYKPVFKKLEMELYSKTYGFAGTADAIAKIGSSTYICDWKSSKDVFEKYKLQVAAYHYAYREMTGETPDGGLILSVRYEKNKEGWKAEMLDSAEIDYWFKRFQTRLQMFKEYNPDFQPKRDLLPVAFLPEATPVQA